MALRAAWTLVATAVRGWIDDRAGSMGAALAYYTAFSLAPLLIIVIAVAGIVFGHDAAQAAVVAQFEGLTGEAGARAVSDVLRSNAGFGDGLVALAVGIATLVLGATTAFVELQDDLDRIFRAPARPGGGAWSLVRTRLLSFAMVLFIGFLLTVSLILSAAVSALGGLLPAAVEALVQVATLALSFALFTVLFALIYKFLPDAPLTWRNVWIGAAVTAFLFEIGKFAIGLYIGRGAVAASFGAAGPFVVLMLWIYYSTQIFLFGAELTCAHAGRKPARARNLEAPAPALEHGGFA